uniref:ERCC4 domain-containing protein n=1 Tax=viral metagenome TaxID=1070528 RepID=A0A6C0CZT8_9ZZZZ
MRVKLVIDYREAAILSILERLNDPPTASSLSLGVVSLLRKNVIMSHNPKPDALEEKLFELKRKMGDALEWEVQNLPVGDAHIYTCCDDYEKKEGEEDIWKLRMMIERKQGQDLWQSVKDGRWKSQHERIESLSTSTSYDGLDVIWVIENFKSSSSSSSSFYQEIETTWKYITSRLVTQRHDHQRHSVFWIPDAHHFVMLCLCLCVNWLKPREGDEVNHGGLDRKKEGCITSIPSKKEYTTPFSFLVSVVASVPGISERLAHRIIDIVLENEESKEEEEPKTRTLTMFCQQLLSKRKQVEEMNTGKEGGAIRKLGKKKVELLCQLFHG